MGRGRIIFFPSVSGGIKFFSHRCSLPRGYRGCPRAIAGNFRCFDRHRQWDDFPRRSLKPALRPARPVSGVCGFHVDNTGSLHGSVHNNQTTTDCVCVCVFFLLLLLPFSVKLPSADVFYREGDFLLRACGKPVTGANERK